jgi:hypothetical protein
VSHDDRKTRNCLELPDPPVNAARRSDIVTELKVCRPVAPLAVRESSAGGMTGPPWPCGM